MFKDKKDIAEMAFLPTEMAINTIVK